ncbi:MAG: TetR/AcrR family transcriptional regulator [Aurantimonas endophytica]|uniref:AcrR family transcriptional regulator n=1 Tax=Aurantimonas endophytica TaxID=1522175 RepID=A0A7W6HGL7_9HYPH|nr:TetR/AcrR family transcriptional regulator [Aurantimonas endophytica]MBB4004587.1 AcrR family transcriptional regulator [Aurantimonas endophytica]MCO6405423.1 TetR family transcriptional regulator [Aurantimonas endophytica]
MARGRPREFDVDEALDKAILLFWRRGYEGTSLADLIDAMGITKPSLYAAFGNKEELFRKAVDRYAERRIATLDAILDQPSSRCAIEGFLMMFTGAEAPDGTPCGCLMVQGALVCSPDGESVKDDLLSRRMSNLKRLCERLERWRADGDLPADTDTESLGRYVITVANGLVVQANGGAKPEQLQKVVRQFMRTWPGKRDESPAVAEICAA